MAVNEIKSNGVVTLPKKYRGLSTDTKPTDDVPNGSSFYERDTKKYWEYDVDNENPATSNGWWEV